MSEESIPIIVKWGKETMSLSLTPSLGVKALKSNLYEKTQVPMERMKLMPKSKGLWRGLLKDDFDFTTVTFDKVKAPITILLMGSAEKLTGPKVKTIFVEDLKPEEAAQHAPEPSGLNNLGNTCYLNSVMQCLRNVKVFRQGLQQSDSNNNSGYANANAVASNTNVPPSVAPFLRTMNSTFHSLDRSLDPVSPTPFVMSTKMAFPQFAETGANGAPQQQDAEEFLSGLLTLAGQGGQMQGKENIMKAYKNAGVDVDEKELVGVGNLVDALFGIQMEETYTCDELEIMKNSENDKNDSAGVDVDVAMADTTSSSAEAAVVRHDLHRKLVCNIQGGSDSASQTNVTHVMEGIALALNGKVEKHSEVLGRDAIWTRTQRMSRLPQILALQFGRFYWKETPDSQDHTGVKCKVMKPVAFNGELDIYEFCSAKVQKVLKKSRDKALKEEEDRVTAKLMGAAKSGADADGGNDEKMGDNDESEKKNASMAMDEEGAGDDDDDLKAALAMSMAAAPTEDDTSDSEDVMVGPGLPKEFQGKYELFAVVTHKGRDADGGHYMGWVKAEEQGGGSKIADTEEDNADWFVFDDDEVSPCKTEDVLKLKGGGDWHMSYLNFYRAKK